jgi:hypothetical protein
MSLKVGEGCQLLRVDLTCISGGSVHLVEHFKMLRRIVERTWGYEVEYFKIETTEGNGVLHMVWAIRSEKPVYIPQKWLSSAWESITGAKIVYICKLGAKRRNKAGRTFQKRSTKEHLKYIARYMAGQYLADQEAIARVSWSWWRNSVKIVRAYREFVGALRRGRFLSGQGLVYNLHRRWEVFEGWNELLRERWWLSDWGKCFYLDEWGHVQIEYSRG